MVHPLPLHSENEDGGHTGSAPAAQAQLRSEGLQLLPSEHVEPRSGWDVPPCPPPGPVLAGSSAMRYRGGRGALAQAGKGAAGGSGGCPCPGKTHFGPFSGQSPKEKNRAAVGSLPWGDRVVWCWGWASWRGVCPRTGHISLHAGSLA